MMKVEQVSGMLDFSLDMTLITARENLTHLLALKEVGLEANTDESDYIIISVIRLQDKIIT
jgi:hypothetical protein